MSKDVKINVIFDVKRLGTRVQHRETLLSRVNRWLRHRFDVVLVIVQDADTGHFRGAYIDHAEAHPLIEND